MKRKTLRQDYYKHKRLGKKWRRPKGRQSKLRKRKSGSGLVIRIGHGSPNKGKINNLQPVIVSNPNIIDSLNKDKQMIIISSTLGVKKALIVAEKAKKLGIKILSNRKIKRAEKITKQIEVKKKEAEQKKKEKAKKAEAEKKKTKEKPVTKPASKLPKEKGEK